MIPVPHARGARAVATVRSSLPGVRWPAITPPDTALALALQYELERSQWLAPAELIALQSRQLEAVLRHAWETVPFYRWHWHCPGANSPDALLERFGGLPLIRRSDIEGGLVSLSSEACPGQHGPVLETGTAGAPGAPRRTLRSAYAALWWRLIALRDHLWHCRDFDGKLAALEPGLATGDAAGWGPETSALESSGRSVTRDLTGDADEWLDWLRGEDPDYLFAPPSVAARLARAALARRVRLPRLKEVRTSGECLAPDARALCREAWGVPLTDAYFREEAGYLALQCPQAEHYHVQSESVLVEILDERGNACPPGGVGRVVVTTLQNFAMPLVRYDTGEFAEAGAPCSCGRGLPVIDRIVAQAPCAGTSTR